MKIAEDIIVRIGAGPASSAESLYSFESDPNIMVHGEYRGQFTPDAEYVLIGK